MAHGAWREIKKCRISNAEFRMTMALKAKQPNAFFQFVESLESLGTASFSN